jgi:hypothetical protein
MLDHDKFSVLLFCVGLIGLFVVVFNMQMVLAALRWIVHYLTHGKNTAFHSSHYRRKTWHA